MIQLAVGNLLCLIVATFCFAAACIIAFLGRITASQKGAVGFFVLAMAFLCTLSGLLLWAGFA
ncbi:MAG: hypothetical protein SXV54_03445 [Chloroflexota bacterium]|nr:hypothetical protein [Chloroflexota bacterium]